jgi:hypothetical protein
VKCLVGRIYGLLFSQNCGTCIYKTVISVEILGTRLRVQGLLNGSSGFVGVIPLRILLEIVQAYTPVVISHTFEVRFRSDFEYVAHSGSSEVGNSLADPCFRVGGGTFGEGNFVIWAQTCSIS